MSTTDTTVIVSHNPPRRRQSKNMPPTMRLVLLGQSVSENSLVGNFILGRAAFDREAPPDVVERVGGRLKDRHVIIINSPQLLRRNISDHQITQTVRECVFLSDPGPHVIVLLLKHEPCSAEDQERVEKVLRSFSESVYQHTVVLTTQEPTETSNVLQNLIQRCSDRHFSLQRSSSPEDLLQMLEHIEKMNDGCYLDCAEDPQSFKKKQQATERPRCDPGLRGPKKPKGLLMENIEQMLEENRGCFFSTETFLEAQMKTILQYEEMKKKYHSLETHLLSQALTRRHLPHGIQAGAGSSENEEGLRIVLLGKTGVGKSASGNTILGREVFTAEESFESVTKESQRHTSEINSRRVTVIDTPGLFDTELSNEQIQREITHCIHMILPGPHVFLLLIPLGRFTKEEENSVKIIQDTFGERSLMYTMVLFTRGDDLKKKTIDQCLGKPGSVIRNLIEACGNRYHVFNNNQTEDPTQVTDLLQKIDLMLETNGGRYYSCKMFREMERE